MKHLKIRITTICLALLVAMSAMSLLFVSANEAVPDLTETPSAEIVFSGASLTLYDNICINFKAEESLFTEVGYENPYVVFEINGEQYIVSDYEVVNGKYVFDFADISPANMNDTVKATLYATFDGVEYISETREYSVATYCYNMLSKYSTDDYAELRTLLVDLLNYGAMTQVYESYNTDELVNAKLTEEQRAWGTSDAPVYKTVQNLSYKTIDNPTVMWTGGGLNLEDSVTMRFKISAESIDNLTVKAETEESIWTISAEEFEVTTGGYYVFFDGLDASQMSEPVYLTIYNGDTPVSNTICYSIESYAYSKQSSTDTNLVNLLEAMMKYGNSAYAYVTTESIEEEETTVPENTEPTEDVTVPVTQPSDDTETIYFIDGTAQGWIGDADAKIYILNYESNETYLGTMQDENTWVFEIPVGMTAIYFYRCQSEFTNTDAWNSWTTCVAERGDENTFTATKNEVGSWSGVPSASTITVYFENTYGWTNVYWHGWNGSGETNTAWPGDPMEKVSGNIYSATVDVSLTNITFNDGSGKEKTSDLIIPGDGQIYSNGIWSAYSGD